LLLIERLLIPNSMCLVRYVILYSFGDEKGIFLLLCSLTILF
jgi:hypothetical protein